mgnify:CR=1 FL=1
MCIIFVISNFCISKTSSGEKIFLQVYFEKWKFIIFLEQSIQVAIENESKIENKVKIIYDKEQIPTPKLKPDRILPTNLTKHNKFDIFNLSKDKKYVTLNAAKEAT